MPATQEACALEKVLHLNITIDYEIHLLPRFFAACVGSCSN
jgi:hypothetical protein